MAVQRALAPQKKTPDTHKPPAAESAAVPTVLHAGAPPAAVDTAVGATPNAPLRARASNPFSSLGSALPLRQSAAVVPAAAAPAVAAAAHPPTPPSPSPPRDAEGLVSYARRERAKFEALAQTHELAMKSLGSVRPSTTSAAHGSSTPTGSLLTRVDNMQSTFEQLRTPRAE